MKLYDIVFTPEAEEQLASIYKHLADVTSPDVARLYTNSVLQYCESFRHTLPQGTLRDDIRPGIKIITYRGRTVVAYAVEADQVVFIGFFHDGQDYGTALRRGKVH